MSDQTSATRARPLRRLLPASTARPPRTATIAPLRQLVTVACNACRKHKAKCSGEKPTCLRCATRHIPCQYVDRTGQTRHGQSRDRVTVHEELLNLLKNVPDKDAQDILQRLRSGTDVTTLVNQVETGNVLLQMAVVPETRLRYQFPYRTEMPDALTANNPYLESLLYEATSLYPSARPSSYLGNPPRLASLGSEEHQSLYLKPFHAAQVIEPLLSDVKVSIWTSVCDDDPLMRRLFAAFFHCEYGFSAVFQKDLFLQDMAAHRNDFCSSLLVNTALAYSCASYPQFSNRAQYWNPNTLTYRFLAEAKRLWELEASEPRITTIQAGILFSVFHNMSGLDDIGQPYRIHSVALAQELDIFDPVGDCQISRLSRGTAYTAWALYNWETLVAFSFMLPPLLKKPPGWSLPDPLEDPEWYGEIWLQYPLHHCLSPSYFGQVFWARSHFRVIVNQFCEAAYSQGPVVDLDQAQKLHLRLQSWYHDLPGSLLPKTIVLPGHLQLHLYYHHLILTIYEPLLHTAPTRAPSPPEKLSPQQIVTGSKKHLQTLIRLYYLRHGFEAMDLFIVIPLMLTGYDCIDAITKETPEHELETLRSTLMLVAQGLYSQRQNHHLAKALFRVLQGRMRPQEYTLLRDTVAPEGDEAGGELDKMQAVRSHWPVSVVKKREDADAYGLTQLLKDCASLDMDKD